MPALPDLPPASAVIVTGPSPTPVTSPDEDTVATAVLLLDHATPRTPIARPFLSSTVAESWSVCPTKSAC